MPENARVATRIPAQDVDRARRFYAEKLGLEPVEERSGALFRSARASPGPFTQMAFELDDLDAVVAECPSKGGRGERAVWVREAL
jgi:catechol 2,3-dioxygenase-like lactoylglutathione lyase family enzyme